MASRSQSQVVDIEIEESGTTQSIREKVQSLKSSFLSRHFDEVEEFLVSTIEKMERKMNLLKKDKEIMEEKAQIEKLVRMKAEHELRECKSENMQLKKAQEGFYGLVRSSGEEKRVIRELREEICELKCVKLKAEREVEAYSSKFEELKMRVLLLEKDLMLLKSEEPVKIDRVSGEVLREQIVVEEKVKAAENVVTVKNEVVSTDSNHNIAVGANLVPSCHSPESTTMRLVPPAAGEGSGKEFVGENRKGREGVVNVKAEMDAVDCHENMVLGTNQGSGHNLVEIVDGKKGASGQSTLRSQEIVEIFDSDDESSTSATSRRRKMIKQGYQHEADLGRQFVSNESKLLKRKQTSCAKSTDDEYRVNKRHSSLTQRSNRALDSDLVDSDSEDSSSSSDSEIPEFTLSLLAKLGIPNRSNKRWKSEADMMAALERQAELCLRAVCALFGQESAVAKSLNFSSTFQNRGITKDDVARGTALAKFLIDGDPQGKLKKTPIELIAYDLQGIVDCKRLALNHSKQLFEMYQQKGDPLFSD